MSYILSLDAGTTSVRAILFDRQGRIRSVAQKEIRQIFPKPGWVEQDPQEIWFSQIIAAAEALAPATLRKGKWARHLFDNNHPKLDTAPGTVDFVATKRVN